ncbi:MAG: PspA/IM30 family protein [Dehalococcoidia bacterium]
MLLRRMKAVFEAKANKAVDAMEDPREMLDLSYEKQVEMLRDVKRGVVEVTAARRRLELQAEEVRAKLPKFDGQARQAMAAGREDLARLALERKQLAQGQLDGFATQVAQLQGEQDRLIQAEARLAAKVEAFRTRKEVVKAQYTAAKATVRIGEAVSGLSEEMADVGMAIQRAEDKTAQLRSRGDAIGELIESGVLDDATGGGSSLDRELDRLGAAGGVELELAALRAQLAPATPPKLLSEAQS